MTNYYIAATKKTPEIYFNIDGNFFISGGSFMVNPEQFYRPLSEWLAVFLQQYTKKIIFKISLEYVNSSSRKQLLNLLFQIKETHLKKIKIIWLYDEGDEDIIELGEGLNGITKLGFDFKKIKN